MRRALLCSLVVGVLVLLTGAPASAHASLLSSDPGEGAVVASVPEQLVLTFNEPVRLDEVQAFTPDGADWAVDAEAQDNRLVVVPEDDPGNGTVVVAWKVTSADGHAVSGSLTFSIGSPSAGVAAPEGAGAAGATRGVEIARAMAVVTLVGALAGIVVLAGVVAVCGALPTRWTHHGLLRILHLLWNAAFVAALALVPLSQLAAEGGSLRDLADWLTWLDGLTRGTSWLLLASVLVAAGLVAVARRTARPRHGSVGVLRGAAAVLVVAVVAPLVVAAAGSESASDGAAASVPTPASGPQTAELGDAGTVTVAATRTEGRSVDLRVTLADPDGAPLRPFAPPTVSVAGGEIDLGEVRLRRTAPGAYRAVVVIPGDGQWRAQVSVRTTEFDNPVSVVPFSVASR